MMGYYYIDRKRWRIGVEDALVLVYLGMGLGIGYDNPLNFFFFFLSAVYLWYLVVDLLGRTCHSFK